jgi:uncharacterized protein (TIGR00255 family)
LQALNEMRGAEGQKLQHFLAEHTAVVEQALIRIADRVPGRFSEQRERLRRNVQELAAGVTLDEARLAQEIAVLADRLDISEELHRFDAHLSAFRDALRADNPDGAGKRLGFILQEMLREANTIGSKANDSAILSEVVTVKEELERMREQVENIA